MEARITSAGTTHRAAALIAEATAPVISRGTGSVYCFATVSATFFVGPSNPRGFFGEDTFSIIVLSRFIYFPREAIVSFVDGQSSNFFFFSIH